MGIRLSKEHGVNPTLEQCFYCMRDVGLILFGALPRQRQHTCRSCKHSWTAVVRHDAHTPNISGEPTPFCPKCNSRGVNSGPAEVDPQAPRRMCVSFEPCSQCADLMKRGIILVSIRDGESESGSDNPYRTGGWIVVTEDAIKRICTDPSHFLEKRFGFVEDTMWDYLGFPRTKEQALALGAEVDLGDKKPTT